MADGLGHPSHRDEEMSWTQRSKLLVDILLVVALIGAMSNKITENAIHEWLGLSMIVMLIVHNALNWRWFTALFRGRYGIRRIVNSSITLLLLASLLVLLASAVMISRTVFPF